MDRLESFISENKNAFDSEVPDLKVWASISEGLDAKELIQSEGKVRPLWKKLRLVAASVALLAIGALGLNVYNSSTLQASGGLAEISPELADMEAFYVQQVNNKIMELDDLEFVEEVKEDMEQLDIVFNELMIEYKNAPEANKEIILQAMINNYKTKLEILDKILLQYKSIQHQKKNQNNEVSI